MSTITATRHHDFSCGHRVVGHEGKCKQLHGHGYRVHFTVQPEHGLDKVGRVLDFSVIKDRLCDWLENNWDHRLLLWKLDPWAGSLYAIDNTIVPVPFNPTAENMAQHLGRIIGPQQLADTGCELYKVIVEETRKCKATWIKGEKE